MKELLAFIFLLILLLPSCKRKNESSVITYKLSKSDYTEKIFVTGTVQAVVNQPVPAPRTMTGQITVARLARDGEYVRKGDTICVLSSPELNTMYETMASTIERLEAEYNRTEADNNLKIALLEAQLATSEAQMKISALDSARMQYAPENRKKILALEIERSVIEKRKIEKKLKATRAINETTLRQLRARMISEKARAQTITDQVNSLTVIAQRDGIVMRTESPQFMFMSSQGIGRLGGPVKEGSVLFSGMPVLQFPDFSRMQISAEVGETDYRKIEKGQKALIVISSKDKVVTTGKVNRKSLAGAPVYFEAPSKVKTYQVIIDIDSCHNKMTPGLSSENEITIREAADTVFVPAMAVFEKDSLKIVYVKEKMKFRPVAVVAGVTGGTHTIIASGLNGDEEIALSEPPSGLLLPANNPLKKDTASNNIQKHTRLP